jgi:2-dehydro-3-deoxygluconokinase
MPVVLTAGETMALLDPGQGGPPRSGAPFTLRVAGAESNFAIALARLGVEARWASRLGDDLLGEMVRETIAAEGVDMRWVRTDSAAPTGLYLKFRESGGTEVAYYRAGSAASRLEPADVPDEALDGVRLVHLTGITMALSESALELVLDLGRRARELGAIVTFDPNYRAPLWDGPTHAEATQRAMLPLVDWYLCGRDEGCELFGANDEDQLIEALRSAGIERTVVRVGERGAILSTGAFVRQVPPARVTEVRDEVGAGDAFAAGFAFGLLHDLESERCAAAGNVIAAAALGGTGDWETLPRLDDVAEDLGL